MSETFLEDVVVVEIGGRISAGLCGALLQRLGADVWVVERQSEEARPDSKAAHRQVLGAGKRLVASAPHGAGAAEYLRRLFERADVVITSSDWSGDPGVELRELLVNVPVVCDVSAFGSSGPLAGMPFTDGMIQALAGLVDTTGRPDGEPVASRVPLTECTAAVFAAAGAVAALRSRRRSARPHRVEVALFDTAVSMLSTFLPMHFTGGSPRRMGNRHPSMSPWNAYAARDGWVLVCSASDEMWGRLCEVIGRPELKSDPRFRKMAGRVENAAAADAALEPWIAQRTIGACLDAFSAVSVPCGPVLTIADVLAEPNLGSRQAVRELREGAQQAALRVPGALMHGAPATGRAPQAAARIAALGELPPPRRSGAAPRSFSGDILAGIRVVEMGNYTTAPLAARNLGALGAYVVKAEPPSGELSRASPPYRDGQSYFCTLSNSDKRSVAVDLRTTEGRKVFHELLARADVFVENMKPGVLARFGFGPEDIARINPGLVYCSVSGYGANSPLADRTAMDTTIQGAAGVMDLTRGSGVPYKAGISISDLLGGQFALLAILAGLEYRERTGRGEAIDLSMQELSAWLTQFFWNGSDGGSAGRVCACSDGYVYAAGSDPSDAPDVRHLTRAQAVAFLEARGVSAAPVNTVSEVARHPQTAARGLIAERPSRKGEVWPLLASPIRITPHSPEVRRAFGRVGEDLDEVSADWGLA